MPRFSTISPDGRRVVFETLGRLYIRDAAGGAAPRLLTAQDGDFQLFPTWSRDGSRIAFVSWNDQRLGEIRTVSADGSTCARSPSIPAITAGPRFSPDGNLIVYDAERRPGPDLEPLVDETGVFRVPATGGPSTRILADGANPQFGADPTRRLRRGSEQQKHKLISVDLNGGNRRDTPRARW